MRARARSAMAVSGPPSGAEARRAVELMQPRVAITPFLRDGIERIVKLHRRAKAWSHVAKLDDLAADGQGRQQSRALQRLGLVRQSRKPAVHAAIPIFRCQSQASGREAAQVAQSEGEQAARAQRR